MRKPALFALAAALLSVSTLATAHAADQSLPTAGEIAPGFTLPSQDGSRISLDSFHGKWVVLYFYPKDMTTRLHHRGAQFSSAISQVRRRQCCDSRRKRGHAGQPQAVLY